MPVSMFSLNEVRKLEGAQESKTINLVEADDQVRPNYLNALRSRIKTK